jgi:hypothetical protein
VSRSPSVRKSKQGWTFFSRPSLSITSTSCSSGASHPKVFEPCVTPGIRRGLSRAPPEVAAIEYRWFGNDGPWALAKKLSNRAYSSAQRQ